MKVEWLGGPHDGTTFDVGDQVRVLEVVFVTSDVLEGKTGECLTVDIPLEVDGDRVIARFPRLPEVDD